MRDGAGRRRSPLWYAAKRGPVSLAVCFKFPASAFLATSAGDSERSLLARGCWPGGLLWSAHNGCRVRYLALNAGTLADNLRCTSGQGEEWWVLTHFGLCCVRRTWCRGGMPGRLRDRGFLRGPKGRLLVNNETCSRSSPFCALRSAAKATPLPAQRGAVGLTQLRPQGPYTWVLTWLPLPCRTLTAGTVNDGRQCSPTSVFALVLYAKQW